MKRLVVCLCVVLFACLSASAFASGEWFWMVNVNPATGTRVFSGVAGSSVPLALSGHIYNNDPAHQLIFNGITLKTDELTPDNLALYDSLWSTDMSVEFPESFTVAGGAQKDFSIGTFNLASAAPGSYKFKLFAAVDYDGAAPNPDQITSDFVTVDVLPVPEPTALIGLGCALTSLVLSRRRRSRIS